MTLSSDSEDELPSLSQRIGLTKAVGSCKWPTNGGLPSEQAVDRGGKEHKVSSSMECRFISNEVPSSTSCVTGQGELNALCKRSNLNSATTVTTAAVMVMAHNNAVSMPIEHTECDVITINDNSPTSVCQEADE